MSSWGEREGVFRDPDATDTTVPPGDVDPRVAVPFRMMTPGEQANASRDWTIVGSSGIALVDPVCLSNDTRSSMEEYWRRRPVILGALSPNMLNSALWASARPSVDAIPIPDGWVCSIWRRDKLAPKAHAGLLVQKAPGGWWRICIQPPASALVANRNPHSTTPTTGATVGGNPIQNFLEGRPVDRPRDSERGPRGEWCEPWIPFMPETVPGYQILRQGNWFRQCPLPRSATTPPAPVAASPIPAAPPVLRPPTEQTPRPALPVEPPPAAARLRVMPNVRIHPAATRVLPGRAARPVRPPPRVPGAADYLNQLFSQAAAAAPGATPPAAPARDVDLDQAMEWIEGQWALAVELSMQPPDVRRAVLVENPEVLYVWMIFGWLDVDADVLRTFQVLADELAIVGLSLFDFEAAIRSELPPALARELQATPMGLAQMVQAAPSLSAPAAGQWDAQSGVFLPTDPWSVEQRASYGYTPQAPTLPDPSIAQTWQEPLESEPTIAEFVAQPQHPDDLAFIREAVAQPGVLPPAVTPPELAQAGLEVRRDAYGTEMIQPAGFRAPADGGHAQGMSRQDAAAQARARRELATARRDFDRTIRTMVSGTTIAGCGCGSEAKPRIGGSLVLRDDGQGGIVEHAPCGTRVGQVEDPRCCPECALEHLGPTARAWVAGIARPSARVGDFWSDLGRGVAAADRWLGDNVWENVKGVVPYGDVIDKAHDARMSILERAAPDFYPSRGTSSGKGSSGGKGSSRKGASSTSSWAAGKGAGALPAKDAASEPSEAATDAAIVTASRLASGVAAGDASTIATVKRIKDRAAAGDPEARRSWRVYVLVARDEHAAT